MSPMPRERMTLRGTMIYVHYDPDTRQITSVNLSGDYLNVTEDMRRTGELSRLQTKLLARLG